MSNRSSRMDHATLAIVATALIGAMILVAVRLPSFSWLTPQSHYSAQLATAGTLKAGDDVKIGGVIVGDITKVDLDGQHVRVEFGVDKSIPLGDQSRANVEIATVLGNVFLQIESGGKGRLQPGAEIPLARTRVPNSLLGTVNLISDRSSRLDQEQLRESLEQLTSTLGGISSQDVSTTVDGLAKLTSALSGRSDEIADLMEGARKITTALEDKGSVIVDVMRQSDIFLSTLNERRDTIAALLEHTDSLSRELTSLIREDGAPLSKALKSVDRISAQLADDAATLTESIDLLSQFSSNLANITGNGPWIDVYLPTGLIPDNVIAKCGTSPSSGCGE